MSTDTSARELGKMADEAVREERELRQDIGDGDDDDYGQDTDELQVSCKR